MRGSKRSKRLSEAFQFLRHISALGSARFKFCQLLHELLKFVADRRELEPQLIQSPREIELVPKLIGRRFNARIDRDGQRLGESFAVNDQRYRVITCRGPG